MICTANWWSFEFAGRLHNDLINRVTVLLNLDCGTTRLRETAQAFPGTFCLPSILAGKSLKIRKMVFDETFLFRAELSSPLSTDYRKFLLRGQYWQRVFLFCFVCFFYSQLLSTYSDLLFPACFVGLFVIFTIF